MAESTGTLGECPGACAAGAVIRSGSVHAPIHAIGACQPCCYRCHPA